MVLVFFGERLGLEYLVCIVDILHLGFGWACAIVRFQLAPNLPRVEPLSWKIMVSLDRWMFITCLSLDGLERQESLLCWRGNTESG
jgi:hypothetical protein